MNILEAFKASSCGKIKLATWADGDFVDKNSGYLSSKLILRDDWEPVNEPLTFERIRKECVAGETLLIGSVGEVRLYLAFTRKGLLVTDCDYDSYAVCWHEESVKDWTIGGKFKRGEG